MILGGDAWRFKENYGQVKSKVPSGRLGKGWYEDVEDNKYNDDIKFVEEVLFKKTENEE